MKCFIHFFIIFLFLLSMDDLLAQGPKKEENSTKIPIDTTPSVTQHKIKIGGKQLAYTVKTGYLTLKTETGQDDAHIFYIAYTKDDAGDPAQRPLTFSFNGGPGSSSVWLHLGVLGPKRVLMTEDGESLAPPYRLVENEYSWLDLTDMVFIDPVTTGFSRAADEKEARKFHGFSGDIQSVGEFIRRYTTDNRRWSSPKYLIGESYGTTRASALSQHLIDQYGYYLNGLILVSSIMDFQTARFERGNDLPYVVFLPTYAATAYYHKKLAPEYLKKTLPEFLKEVEKFAIEEYSVALLKGDLLQGKEREQVLKKLEAYTGLSQTYLERANLRPVIYAFCKELLRGEYQVVGRFDSRYKYVDKSNGNAESGEFDPSYQPTILGSFGTLINDYIGRDLNYKNILPYNILTGRVQPWDYSNFTNRYVNTAESLRRAMVMNPHMKVWIGNGYYDLATPYFATEHTVNHLALDKDLAKNIWMTYYPAGHMMYLQKKSLEQMRQEAVEFYTKRSK
jgi:carboxypeptidase C (cathepsin A)